MPTYTVIPQANQTFQVAIVGDDGARQTLLGFETQAEVEAWIARDRRQSAANARDEAYDSGRLHSPTRVGGIPCLQLYRERLRRGVWRSRCPCWSLRALGAASQRISRRVMARWSGTARRS